MSSQNIRRMAATAVLIALAIAFQNLRFVLGGSNPVSTYLISTLVNICLITAACIVGLWSGFSIALITPLIALWQGHAPAPMVPWIIAGNAVLVLCYTLIAGKIKMNTKMHWFRWALAGVTAATVKFAVILTGQAFMFSSAQGLAFRAAIGVAFGVQIQQPITALLATVIARLIIAALPRTIKE